MTRIFQMRVDGVPVNQIAVKLESEGIPSPGKLRYLRKQTSDKRYATSKWSAQLIKQILKDPAYLGGPVFGRMPTALYLGKPDCHYEPDESKWRVLKNKPERLTGSYECPNHKYGRCEYTHTITQEKLKKIVGQSFQDQLLVFCDYEKVLEPQEQAGTSV